MTIELNPTTGQRFDVFGPAVEILTSPQDVHNDFCILKGVIPPGGSIPLHSHADTEDFFVLSGQAQALKHDSSGSEWVTGKTGDLIHVPSGAPHALRNVSREPLIVLILTTTRMGRFFQETGRPVTSVPQPVTPEDFAHFVTVSAAYGYWNATPEENAAIGIDVSFHKVPGSAEGGTEGR